MKSIFLSVMAMSCACVTAQTPGTGFYAFATIDNRGFDQINVGNLNVQFTVPIVSKQGRGLPFVYTLQYEGLVWQPVNNGSVTAWVPSTNWGFSGSLNGTAVVGYLSYTSAPIPCGTERAGGRTITVYGTSTSNYAYHDPFGATHLFNYATNRTPMQCTRGTGNGSSQDGSGYTLVSSGTKVQNSAGITITPPTWVNGSGYIAAGNQIDANGNEISYDGSASYTDTTGTSELTISGSNPVQFTYPVALQSNNATTASASLTYKAYTVQTNFSCSNIVEYGSSTVDLVDHISLANGDTYSFTYEPTPGTSSGAVTGRIASITVPNGGTISYTYSGGTSGANGIWCSDGTTGGLTRQTTDGTRTYARTATSGTSAFTTTVTDEKSNQTQYYFSVDSIGQYESTHQQVYQGSLNASLLMERFVCYNGAAAPCDGGGITQPITSSTTITSYNGGSQATETDTYDSSGQFLIESKQSGSSLLLDTINTYATPGPTTELTSTTVKDGSGNVVSYAQYRYDQTTPIATSSLPQHGSPAANPGNLTSSSTSIDGSTTNLLTSQTSYYDTGMPSTTTAVGGFTTTYGYESTGTFVNSTTYPATSSGVTLSTSASYDVASGALLSMTGANSGQTTTVNTYDARLRALDVQQPNGGHVRTVYNFPNFPYVTTDLNSSGQVAQVSYYPDTYGRLSRAAVLNGQSSNPWYQTDNCYDATGLVSFVPVAYQSVGWGTPIRCSGAGTSYLYDGLGRLYSTTTYDGTVTTTATITYQNRAVETTDVNGIQKITQYDLLGRVSGICEISSAALNGVNPTPCGMDISGTGFVTSYSYNLANHTTTITQGSESRVFQTDAAGRTTSVQEPERGTTNYSYAYNTTGLVVTRTRPQANQTNPAVFTHTTTQYDTMGRVIGIGYDDGLTPTKEFWYDTAGPLGWSQAPTNPKGQLVSAATVNSSGTPYTSMQYSYDISGRPVTVWQCAPSICGTGNQQSRGADTTSYDYAGNITGLSDTVSGAITYTRSAAGELTSATQTTYGGAASAPNLVTNVTNTPFGPTSYNIGNGLGVSKAYDGLGRYHATWVCSGSLSAYCSGGVQLFGHGDNFTGTQNTETCDTVINQCESHAYDAFNRLQSVSGGNNQYSYSYDIYGNRLTQSSSPSGPSPSYSFSNNNQIVGLSYDAAGNLMNDGIAHSFTYDAEGNVLSVDNGSTAVYVYDAMNRRVSAQTGSGTNEYVYNTLGQRSGEWLASSGSVGTGIEGRIYWDGQQIAYRASDGTTYFQHKSPLGTDRMRTDYQGNVATSETSLAFGDGFSSTNGNPSGPGQDTDQFAGLEHDRESSSEHATFRQYSSTQGRWMSPDPYDGSYDPTNPQSLNRYAYDDNMPISQVDPSGLYSINPDYYFYQLANFCWTFMAACNANSHPNPAPTGGGTGGPGGGGAGVANIAAPIKGIGPNPCATSNPAALNYSIYGAYGYIVADHIFPGAGNKSTYTFDLGFGAPGPIQAPSKLFAIVAGYNAYTLNFGVLTGMQGQNAAISAVIPPGLQNQSPVNPGAIGYDSNNGNSPTSTNTLVVRVPGCTNVLTSFPGVPR